jgi:L-threonylcarbamoyladenylate synthase
MGVTEQLDVISAQRFAEVITDGGVAVFPADTVYGVACDPDNAQAARHMYETKGRPQDKPVAVMFFSVTRLLDTLDELDADTRAAVVQLLPGPYTLVVPNPRGRFLAASAGLPGQMGLRVPALAGDLEPLTNVRIPVMQTSANLSGGPDAHTLQDVDPAVLAAVDLALDGGAVDGTASTVVDLTPEDGWRCLRRGAEGAYSHAVQALGEPQSG